MDQLLARGIAAARAGDKEKARRILTEVLRQDRRNEQAWLWLSATADSPRESLICLRQALSINPKNPHTREGLRWARARLAQTKGHSRVERVRSDSPRPRSAPIHASPCGVAGSPNLSEARTDALLPLLMIVLLGLSLILGFALLVWAANVRHFI